MFDVLALEELPKVFCGEGRTIFCVDDAGGSVLGDEVLGVVWMRERIDLKVTLYRKGYLLNKSQTSR